ncbi:hypothetical protein [Pyxidicoccus xibeiensis]|uniref:hypothetical protein n=1 Tax=Pyxidicoccus xibeiensis TaxID=2906759 RepID=UPI0020A6F97F|nr:hypothetical protein [Pyxidicoccus xibeiensis]MCP3139567.1 hypothetical protein [Pyxidicoccus xibeiensis]
MSDSRPVMMIREAQLRTLGQSTVDTFSSRLAVHLRRFFPDRCDALGEALPGFIAHGVARARHHGLRSEREVCRYAGLMCVLGRDFDTAPGLEWARELLELEHLAPALRLDVLTRETQEWLRAAPSGGAP